ncbi:MAG: hypothetical protein GX620_15540 [Chloroflexi bacterium]|nr:hypothetical protein [Chloroflexota bacterium]
MSNRWKMRLAYVVAILLAFLIAAAVWLNGCCLRIAWLSRPQWAVRLEPTAITTHCPTRWTGAGVALFWGVLGIMLATAIVIAVHSWYRWDG